GQEIPVPQLHPPVHLQPSLVRRRDIERVRRGVRCDDTRVPPRVRDRERDRPRTHTYIEHLRTLDRAEQLEAALDDDLRLRPRDEDARIDGQGEPPTPPL